YRWKIGFLRKFFAFGDQFFDALIYRLYFLLRGVIIFQDNIQDLGDRIYLFVFLYLLLGSIMLCIGHGMAPVSVGLHFQKRRSAARSCPLYGLAHFLGNGYRIHTIYRATGHFIAKAELPYFGGMGGPGNRCSHSITVVFTNEHHG